MQFKRRAHEQRLLDHYQSDTTRFRMHERLEGKGVFVLYSNRSGSNLFVELLNQQSSLSIRREVFNPDGVIRNSKNNGLNSFSDYVHWLRRDLATPCWGAKINCIQLEMMWRSGLLSAFHDGCYLIWVKRRNLAAQAVSHYITFDTKQWTSEQTGKQPKPAYDFNKIRQRFESRGQATKRTELLLSLIDIPHRTVWYEDFCAAPAAVLHETMQFIEEPFSTPDLNSLPLKRQTDPVKEEYGRRFIEEARTHYNLNLDAEFL
jgi:LPS sulfotransferase NodH